MKKIVIVFFLSLSLFVAHSQATMKPYTVGDPFTISLPDYLSQATGVNENAVFEYQNEEKGVYGFVIEDNKTIMKIAGISFGSISEFYTAFARDFVEGETKVKQTAPLTKKMGEVNFLEAEISYFDKGAKAEIYYLMGIVETKTAFYKVMSYCSLADKDKFKEDFRKILYSFKD